MIGKIGSFIHATGKGKFSTDDTEDDLSKTYRKKKVAEEKVKPRKKRGRPPVNTDKSCDIPHLQLWFQHVYFQYVF